MRHVKSEPEDTCTVNLSLVYGNWQWTVSSPVSAAVPPAAAVSVGQLGPHTTGMSGGAVGCATTRRDTLRGQMPTLFGVFTQVGEADEYFIFSFNFYYHG